MTCAKQFMPSMMSSRDGVRFSPLLFCVLWAFSFIPSVLAIWSTKCSVNITESATCEQDFVQRKGHTLTQLNATTHLILGGDFIKTYRTERGPNISRIAAYDASNSAWIDISIGGQAPESRTHHTAVLLGDKIVVYGGRLSSAGAPVRDVTLLDTTSWQWIPSSDYVLDNVAAPPPLDTHASVVMGSTMYVVGGSSPDRVVSWCGTCEYTNDVYAFTKLEEMPEGLPAYSWSQLDSPSLIRLPVRKGHSLLARPQSNQIVVFGGMGYNTQRPTDFQGDVEFYQDTWTFDVSSFVWTHVNATGPLPPRRMGHVAEMHDGRMYIHGGFHLLKEGPRYTARTYRDEALTLLDDLWQFNFDTKSWTLTSPSGGSTPLARSWHASALYAPGSGSSSSVELHIIGGMVQKACPDSTSPCPS